MGLDSEGGGSKWHGKRRARGTASQGMMWHGDGAAEYSMEGDNMTAWKQEVRGAGYSVTALERQSGAELQTT